MIKEQFLYFAQYPDRKGARAILTNESASIPGYADLVEAIDRLPNEPRVPEIKNYVYGQSFDQLSARIDRLFGTYLFVDYGEFSMLSDHPGSFRLSQRIAITVADKMPERADSAEYMLASDTTLRLLTRVHAFLIADATRGDIPWFSRSDLDKAEIVPFVASELHSVGWTLMMSCVAPDTLGTHDLSRSFEKQMR